MLRHHVEEAVGLVGREPLMLSIAEALALSGRGARQALLVAGEAGIGKSRCLREIEARARDAGFVVRPARCLEALRAREGPPRSSGRGRA